MSDATNPIRILSVDDHRLLREGLAVPPGKHQFIFGYGGGGHQATRFRSIGMTRAKITSRL